MPTAIKLLLLSLLAPLGAAQDLGFGPVPPGAGGSGTVTSVAETVPTELSVAGSPVTTTGTLAVTWSSASGNKVIASPADGTSGAYAGRALVALDIPSLAASKITSGSLAIAQGGTGQATAAAGFDALSPLTTKGDLLAYSTTGARVAVGANGTTLQADSTASTGVSWVAGLPRMLTASSTAIPITGDTNLHTLVTYSLAGGAWHQHGILKINMAWSMTNNANTKTLTTNYGATAISSFNGLNMATLTKELSIGLRTTSSEVALLTATPNSYGSSSSAVTTASIDSTTAQNITIQVTLGVNTDTVTLEHYEIWLCNP